REPAARALRPAGHGLRMDARRRRARRARRLPRRDHREPDRREPRSPLAEAGGCPGRRRGMDRGRKRMSRTERLTQFLDGCTQIARTTDPIVTTGKLTRVTGLVMEASGLRLAVGSRCSVVLPHIHPVEAEVVGFSEDRLFLMPAGDVHGITPGARVMPAPIA